MKRRQSQILKACDEAVQNAPDIKMHVNLFKSGFAGYQSRFSEKDYTNTPETQYFRLDTAQIL